MARIQSLPTELTSSILASVVKASDHYPELQNCRLMLVCRHWKNVAVATPEMWTDIYLREFSFTSLLRLFIQRSRSALLNVSICSPCRPSLYLPILDNAHRLRSLTAGCLPPDFELLLPQLALRSFPHLHTLSLFLHFGDDGPADDYDHSSLVLPQALISNGLPLLRDLSLIAIHGSFASLNALHSLEISSYDGPIILVAELLAVLNSSPQLGLLSLQHALFSELDVVPKVHLEFLRELRVADEAEAVLELFSALTFAPNAIVDLNLDGSYDDDEDALEVVLAPLANYVREAPNTYPAPARMGHQNSTNQRRINAANVDAASMQRQTIDGKLAEIPERTRTALVRDRAGPGG
ncbi:hypothetical protein C8F01DRAFT_1376715 [Mycena amicta]|nr:hypothetical protein C8F01DRAFT_1376715 [Mycena amicta]